MGWVVFLRAANVGGHQTFRPGVLAREMAGFGVVNVGAAGTFVVRGKVGGVALKAEILRRLPFAPELMICPAREVVALARREPFRDHLSEKGMTGFVTVMARTPRARLLLPLELPATGPWEVKVIDISGRFVLSLRRPREKGVLYPNAVVEKHWGVPATTRNWNTISTIAGMLE